MTQIVKLKLALIFAGSVLAWLGYNEFQLSNHATKTPQRVELPEIEAERIPDNPHLEIGTHWRMYQALLFRYEQKKGSDGVTDATPIDYAYYPILSTTYPFFGEPAEAATVRGVAAELGQPATSWASATARSGRRRRGSARSSPHSAAPTPTPLATGLADGPARAEAISRWGVGRASGQRRCRRAVCARRVRSRGPSRRGLA